MSTYWQLLDEFLVTQARALPGIQFAAAGDLADVDTSPLPMVLVRGLEATLGPGAHGDGVVHRAAAYTYYLAAVVVGDDYAAAKRLAQGFLPGLEGLMYAPALFGLVGADGERTERVEPREMYVEVRMRRAGANQKHLGTAVVSFTVHAET
jgi:hypothetical protein